MNPTNQPAPEVCPKCGAAQSTRRNGVVLDREWDCRSSHYEDENNGEFYQSPFCKLAVAEGKLEEIRTWQAKVRLLDSERDSILAIINRGTK